MQQVGGNLWTLGGEWVMGTEDQCVYIASKY